MNGVWNAGENGRSRSGKVSLALLTVLRSATTLGVFVKFTWDTAQDHIWFAQWRDPGTGLRLYAVVEGLPGRREWDWAVWLPDEPKLTRRGIARSAVEASTAAGEAAEACLQDSGGILGKMWSQL